MIENPAEYQKNLLDKLSRKEITMGELEKECAYWFMYCFDEVKPKPYPTMPKEYHEYLSLPFERKQKMSQEFWQQTIIKNYLDVKEKIKNENDANLFHLKNYLKHIPEGDFLAKSKFKEKIKDFELKDFI